MPYGIVYHLFNTVNGKAYVGQTINTLELRWKGHLRAARSAQPWPISRAIAGYGPDVFVRTVLTECSSQEELDAAELYWGEFFDCLVPNGYCLKLGEGRGRLSEETRRRISVGNKGKNAGRSSWAKGVPKDKTYRAKIAASEKGKKVSDETRKKLRESHLGKTHSPETKQKRNESLKRAWASSEARRKLSESMKRAWATRKARKI